jgi:cystathionine gamma-synthase
MVEHPTEVGAIFTEFPSNPLLKTPPIHSLRNLTQRCDALLIVDDTIACFANASLLPRMYLLHIGLE